MKLSSNDMTNKSAAIWYRPSNSWRNDIVAVCTNIILCTIWSNIGGEVFKNVDDYISSVISIHDKEYEALKI